MIETPTEPQAPAKRRLTRRDLVRIAVVAGAIGAVVGISGAIGRSSQDPYERAMEEAGTDLMELPGFDARFDAVDEEEAFESGAQLGMAAIPHLPDPEFAEYLEITRRMIGALDDEVCAALALGTIDEEGMFEAVRTLDLETVQRYVDLLVSAARIELAGQGAAPPTPAEVQAAFDELTSEVGTARIAEIGALFMDPTAASDESLCAATRDLYTALAALPPDSTRAILRSLLVPRASA